VGISSINPRAAVFFDRDGVLVKAVVRDGRPHPPRHEDEFELESEAREGLARLCAFIPELFVVSNQPDVARGTLSREAAEAMNAQVVRELPIVSSYICYHDDPDRCSCRKPRPGLLERAADEHGLDLRRSYLVGDRWRDIDAGAVAGCTTILIDRNYDEKAPLHEPDYRVATLADAVETIISIERTRGLAHEPEVF
jgi:D-glycero-D-manno-heptose 1,7-bisphosphate phosphatase